METDRFVGIGIAFLLTRNSSNRPIKCARSKNGADFGIVKRPNRRNLQIGFSPNMRLLEEGEVIRETYEVERFLGAGSICRGVPREAPNFSGVRQ